MYLSDTEIGINIFFPKKLKLRETRENMSCDAPAAWLLAS